MAQLTLPLPLVGGLLLAAPLAAQATAPTAEEVYSIRGRVHYDLATGSITKLVRPRQVKKLEASAEATPDSNGRAAVRTFINSITSGYFTRGTLGHEYVDWAAKNTTGPFIMGVTFGYATRSIDTANGGPGAALGLSFYSGTNGGCALGTEVRRLSFTGLPGRTPSIPGGLGTGYFITAFLQEGICIPNGQMGWGYSFIDSDGQGVSNTGPLLTDFGTNTGWSDGYDRWAGNPASLNTCIDTFNFGGCTTGMVPPPATGGTPCSSFILELVEYSPGLFGSCTSRNAGNPENLTAVNAPIIGGSFIATTVAPLAGYAISPASFPGFPLSGAINGVLFCDPTFLFGGIQVTVTGTIQAVVPKTPGLEGVAVCVQAAEFVGPGNFQLTNALDCTIGG